MHAEGPVDRHSPKCICCCIHPLLDGSVSGTGILVKPRVGYRASKNLRKTATMVVSGPLTGGWSPCCLLQTTVEVMKKVLKGEKVSVWWSLLRMVGILYKLIRSACQMSA
jgi:hypothetical protein